MEKRNYVTSYRTPENGFEKDASFEDDIVDEAVSELTKKAIAEDEKSDKEFYSKSK